MNLDTLKASLKKHEGVRLKPYRCTSGKLTIGCGRNLDDRGISERESDYLLENDIHDAIFDLDREHHGWRNHSSGVQNVLIEMVFNMGMPRFNTFTKMLAALDIQDYQTAAEEMLSSRWAEQVKGRAFSLAEIMRKG